MSTNKSDLSDIANRIIVLSSSYATDKEFLKKCDISNLSFVTDVKKGRANSPGADKLAKIVRGTGCSGTWLLTGEGEKYPQPGESRAAEPEEHYIADFQQAIRLIKSLEQRKDVLKEIEIPADLPLQFSRLTTVLLEAQLGNKND